MDFHGDIQVLRISSAVVTTYCYPAAVIWSYEINHIYLKQKVARAKTKNSTILNIHTNMHMHQYTYTVPSNDILRRMYKIQKKPKGNKTYEKNRRSKLQRFNNGKSGGADFAYRQQTHTNCLVLIVMVFVIVVVSILFHLFVIIFFKFFRDFFLSLLLSIIIALRLMFSYLFLGCMCTRIVMICNQCKFSDQI